jgi:hypothetical protein
VKKRALPPSRQDNLLHKFPNKKPEKVRNFPPSTLKAAHVLVTLRLWLRARGASSSKNHSAAGGESRSSGITRRVNRRVGGKVGVVPVRVKQYSKGN